MNHSPLFTHFKSAINTIALPEVFAYPIAYDPHPIALIAVTELQHCIQNDIDWNHDFGLQKTKSVNALGKMFGVLVVKNNEGELGYLSAFSGHIDGHQLEDVFVPSIYDRFNGKDHFYSESLVLDKLSKEINILEADPNLTKAKKAYELIKTKHTSILLNEKRKGKKESLERKIERNRTNGDALTALSQKHNQESINFNFFYKAYTEYLDNKLTPFQNAFDKLNDKIVTLKKQRRDKSSALQDWLFAQYNFVSSQGKSMNVVDVFRESFPSVPPTGAGDCAAPKLFQYAFKNELTPIAMAEFWWGKAPASQVRKHQYFYPACRGKCAPILTHMLTGMNVSPNPRLTNPALGKKIETIYEDAYLVVINKPAGFLSVPGKFIRDSVQERMTQKYPDVTSPMMVHRLDMSTSGVMVVAKSKVVHQTLQDDFKKRKITKRYIALLDGLLESDEGTIDLPLRVDLNNRPFQLVCYEHGKQSKTRYEVIQRNLKTNTTKVYFYPLSGRTHQLRVHAAHQDGLGMPIVGDGLYGIKKDRLHLHAELLGFEHPVSKEAMEFKVDAEF